MLFLIFGKGEKKKGRQSRPDKDFFESILKETAAAHTSPLFTLFEFTRQGKRDSYLL